MDTRIIISLFLLILGPPLAIQSAAEEVATVQETPDLDDAVTLKKILAEALLLTTLQERGQEGAKLLYAPDSNPLFPALRSGHRLIQRPSRQKQIPSSNG